MASCVTFPTLTRTDESTSESLSTTFSNSVSTAPPTTSIITVVSCNAGPSGTCTQPASTVFTVIPGSTTTVQVPVTATVDVVATHIATLFGTSCQNNPPDTSVSTPPPDTSSSSTTSSSAIFTPPPTTFTTQSTSTEANGSVVVSVVTVTSTSSPLTSSSSSLPPLQTDNQQGGNNSNNKTNLAPIIGGAVGGFFGLIAIVFVIWLIIKRRRRWDDIFERDEDEFIASIANKKTPAVDAEPKPYQYGLVGHTPSPIPHSPPLTATTFGRDQPPESQHGRNRSSLTPLMASVMASPSSGMSMTSLSSHPSASSSGQTFGAVSSQGLPFGAYQPQTSHSHSLSTGSITSASGQQTRQTSYSGSNYNSGTPGFTPSLGMASVVQEDVGYFNRSGSPISIQEPRILQVANAPISPASPVDAFAESSTAAAAASAVSGPMRDGKGRPIKSASSKPPLVHLDGGRYQEGAGSSSAVNAPPAYAE